MRLPVHTIPSSPTPLDALTTPRAHHPTRKGTPVMDDLYTYLHDLVFAADRIAEATRKGNLQVMFREIDHALAAPVPGSVYEAEMAVLTALAAQVDVATRQIDRLAWAAQVKPLAPFLRGIPQLATGMAATVHGADRDAITHAFQSSLEGVSKVWPDPAVALAVALAMQIDTSVPVRARNAWTLNLADSDSDVMAVAA